MTQEGQRHYARTPTAELERLMRDSGVPTERAAISGELTRRYEDRLLGPAPAGPPPGASPPPPQVRQPPNMPPPPQPQYVPPQQRPAPPLPHSQESPVPRQQPPQVPVPPPPATPPRSKRLRKRLIIPGIILLIVFVAGVLIPLSAGIVVVAIGLILLGAVVSYAVDMVRRRGGG
jgi:hypothetical protein